MKKSKLKLKLKILNKIENTAREPRSRRVLF